MTATKGEFKGNPTITLKWVEEDKYGFTFGVAKAKLILKELEAIKQFVEENKGGTNGEKK